MMNTEVGNSKSQKPDNQETHGAANARKTDISSHGAQSNF